MNKSSPTYGLLLINGELREASDGRRFDVWNPADESLVGSVAEATLDDVRAAVGAARKAFDTTDWSTNREFRKHCLKQLQAALRTEAAEFRNLQIAEAGLCWQQGQRIDITIEEMSYKIGLIDSFQWEQDYGPYEILGFRSLRRVRYEPYGVVGAITPWNSPLLTCLWKCVPGMAAGNTIVLKTAADTPLAGALFAKLVKERTDIPPGVLNVISSSDNVIGGDGLTGDPRVDMFHFTGSTAIGERVGERAAKGIRKVVLELGGKSANIVLPDADLDSCLPDSVSKCMRNSGQGCMLATRMVVHESIYDEVVKRVADIVSKVPFGDPRDPKNVVGPIIRKAQLERIAGLVDRARAAGARVVAGGRIVDFNGKGNWYAPTAVVDVDENAEIAQTEVFGPVLSVLKYSGGDDEAVRIANNSKYGLCGYVQSRDEDRARRVAEKMRTGTVAIDRSLPLAPDTPFGGYGMSGIGRENGMEGFREFLQTKTIATVAR